MNIKMERREGKNERIYMAVFDIAGHLCGVCKICAGNKTSDLLVGNYALPDAVCRTSGR